MSYFHTSILRPKVVNFFLNVYHTLNNMLLIYSKNVKFKEYIKYILTLYSNFWQKLCIKSLIDCQVKNIFPFKKILIRYILQGAFNIYLKTKWCFRLILVIKII